MSEPKALTLADLPRQECPGDVGIRVDDDGGIWIPLGLSMTSTNRVGQPYFAQVQKRREWHQNKTLGGHRATTQVRLDISKCSVCKFLIGRGFIQTELYARPVLSIKKKRDVLEWKPVCGGCAIRYFDLPHGFCVLADADWTSDHQQHITKPKLRMVWNEKIALLQDTLFQAMFAFILEAERRHWKTHKGDLTHFHRQPILEAWVKIQQPAVATFSELYPIVAQYKQRKVTRHAA